MKISVGRYFEIIEQEVRALLHEADTPIISFLKDEFLDDSDEEQLYNQAQNDIKDVEEVLVKLGFSGATAKKMAYDIYMDALKSVK